MYFFVALASLAVLYDWRPILLASVLLCSLPQLIGSLIGAAAMSLVIGFYHRPDRYIAAS